MTKMSCWDVFRSLLTVGFHKKVVRRNGVAVIQQDGYISSLMLYLFVTAVLIGLMLSYNLSDKIDPPNAQYPVLGASSLVILLSICGLLTVTFNAKVRRMIHCYRLCSTTFIAGYLRNWARNAQTVIPVMGMLFFLIGIQFMELSRALAYTECIISHGFYTYRFLVIVVHLLNSGFSVSVFLFICVYSSKQRDLVNSSRIRYILALILAAMTYFYVDMTVFIHWSRTGSSVNICESASKQLRQQCVCMKTKLDAAANGVGRYMHPFYIEFFLLAIERMFHRFDSMGPDHRSLSGDLVT